MKGDLKALYQQYSESDGVGTYEEFVQAKEQLGDEEFNALINDTVKKKDQPTENGNPSLTNGTPPSQTDLPILTNPIPENEFMVPLGSEQDLSSPSLGITAEMPSTDLPSTATVSSGLENSNVAQQPTYQAPDYGKVIYPIGNDEIDQRNNFVRNQWRLSTDNTPPLGVKENNAVSTQSKKSSILFGDDVNYESVIDDEGNKAFTKIDGYGYLPNYVLPDPNEDKDLLFDRDGNVNKWIPESEAKYREDLSPAPLNGYYAISFAKTDADKKEDNANIERLSKEGVVDIEKENGNPIYENGLLKWKITDKDYYDKIYLPYIARVNSERKNKTEEEGLNKVYHDRGLIERPNTDFEDVLDDYEKVFGKKPTDEEVLSIKDEATLNAFRVNTEFERLKKENPDVDVNSLYQQAVNKYSKSYTPSDLQTGNNVMSLLRDSFQENAQLSEDNPLLLTRDNSDRIFRDEDKEEFDMFQSLASDKSRLGMFGKWWKEEGELEYGSNFVRQKRLEKQETRMDMIASFNDWLERDSNVLLEAKYNRIKNARFKTRQAVESGNQELITQNAENTTNLINDYTEFGNQYKGRQEDFKSILGNFRRTQGKILDEENKKANFISGKDKPAQYAANFVLGIASSLQDTVTGIARLATLPLGQGNTSDFIDDLSQDISINGYKSAPLSLNIKRYEGGEDEGGKYEYRDVNGTKYLYRPETQQYSNLFGDIPKDAKFIDKETEYTVAGFVFQGSKMATDILSTTAVGTYINKGVGFVAEKAFKFSRANTLLNTKNLATVFGAESPLAKSSAALYKASRNTSNISVTGWIPQMTEDSYQTGKEAGLTGGYLGTYTVFNAGLQSLIQRINPDVKFLQSIKTDHSNLLNALLSKNTDKALLYFNNIKNKIVNNSVRETSEEFTQQVTQDVTNLFTNALTDSKLKFSTADDYRDVLISTPILAGAMGATMGRNGKSTVSVNGKEYNLSDFNRNEIATLTALSGNNDGFIKDYINSALFPSVKKRAEEILNEVQTRRKFVDKIPNKENHSIKAITEVAPLMQKLEQKRDELKKDDGTFAERINRDISDLTTQVNAILDNDLTQNNESPNAETAQPTPQSETVQEQTTETEQPQVTTESEQPTIAGEQNVSAELNPTQNSLIVFGKESFGLPILEGFESRYDESQKILSEIDFNNEQSITEGIDKIANIKSGKIISETKTTPEKFIRRKGLADNESVRTKSYLEKYLASSYKDFSSLDNNANENKALENKIELTLNKGSFEGEFLNDYELIGDGSESTVSDCGVGCAVSALGDSLFCVKSLSKIAFTSLVSFKISLFILSEKVPSSFFNCSFCLSISCNIGDTSANAGVEYFSASGTLLINLDRVEISFCISVATSFWLWKYASFLKFDNISNPSLLLANSVINSLRLYIDRSISLLFMLTILLLPPPAKDNTIDVPIVPNATSL